MRISLKASQYMMLSKTKVQGKTILDTRSMQIARSLLLFMISFVSTPPPSLAFPPLGAAASSAAAFVPFLN